MSRVRVVPKTVRAVSTGVVAVLFLCFAASTLVLGGCSGSDSGEPLAASKFRAADPVLARLLEDLALSPGTSRRSSVSSRASEEVPADRAVVRLEVFWSETGEPASNLWFAYGAEFDTVLRATTDARGVCELELLPEDWVFTRGWSSRVQVSLPPGHETRIRWFVSAGAAGISGQVLNEAGQPAAGARVRLLEHSLIAEPVLQQRSQTADSAGRFAFEPPFSDLVLVLEAEHGDLRARTHVTVLEPGEHRRRILRLRSDGGELSDKATPAQRVEVAGVARDAQGEVLAGVTVSAIRRFAKESSTTEFSTASTRSDARGRFRLEVGVGEAVHAHHPRHGETRVNLDEITEEWNAVLERDAVVRGFVVDGAGRGLEGWWVANPRISWSGVRTGPDGGFALAVEKDQWGGVTLTGSPTGDPYKTLLLHDGEFGADPLMLVAEDFDATATLVGAFRWPTTPRPRYLGLWVSGVPTGSWSFRAGPDGTFIVPNLPPGTYRLASIGDRSSNSLGTVELAAGQVLNLGALDVESPGLAFVYLEAPGFRSPIGYYRDRAGEEHEIATGIRSAFDRIEGASDRAEGWIPADAQAVGLKVRGVPVQWVDVDLEPGDDIELRFDPKNGLLPQDLLLKGAGSWYYRVLDERSEQVIPLPPQEWLNVWIPKGTAPAREILFYLDPGPYQLQWLIPGSDPRSRAFTVPGPPLELGR